MTEKGFGAADPGHPPQYIDEQPTIDLQLEATQKSAQMQPVDVARSLSAQWPGREVQARQLATLFNVGVSRTLMGSWAHGRHYDQPAESSIERDMLMDK